MLLAKPPNARIKQAKHHSGEGRGPCFAAATAATLLTSPLTSAGHVAGFCVALLNHC